MVFPFIYIAIFIGWFLLALGIHLENYPITILAAFFIMVIGFPILTDGIEGLYNIAVEGLGLIHIAVGGYVGITKGIDFMSDYL